MDLEIETKYWWECEECHQKKIHCISTSKGSDRGETYCGICGKVVVVWKESKSWVSVQSLKQWAKKTLEDDCNAPMGTQVSFVSIENLLDSLKTKDGNGDTP